MKVLMLCLEFPPVNTTGNYRSAGFARYLCKNNVQTVVITGTVDSVEKTFSKKSDQSLLHGLESAKIYRLPIAPISSFWTKGIANKVRIWWNSTDKIDKRWYFASNKTKINSIVSKECPDLLYVSLPPFSMAKTAMKIAKRFNLPLVTDMRDAWSLWVSQPYSTRLHYYYIYYLERRLLKQSTMVITVTPELSKDFIEQHPNLNSEKFTTLFNGYDNFSSKLDRVKNDGAAFDDKIYRIGYTGSFYYHPDLEDIMKTKWYLRKGLRKLYYVPRDEQWIYRSPFFFLKCMSRLLEINPRLKTKILFEYIGAAPSWLNKMIFDLNLGENFIHHGFVSKQKVLQIHVCHKSCHTFCF